MKYEDRIILFLDFLGFKNYIEHNKEIDIIKLYKTISEIFAINEEYWEVFKSKSISQFSDCLVVSYNKKKDPDSILLLIESIQRIHIELLKSKILIRGAIKIDRLFHKKFYLENGNKSKHNIIFGDAIVKAYEVESITSIYPRTVVGNEVIEFINNTRFKKFKKMYNKDKVLEALIKDLDGYYYVDYIKSPETILDSKQINPFEYGVMLENIITEGLENKKESIKQKYMWLNAKMVSSRIFNS